MANNERSKHITEGVTRAPNRSMYYGMGYKEADFANPMIGVANGHSTITPCNSGLQPLVDAAIAAIREAKGSKANEILVIIYHSLCLIDICVSENIQYERRACEA
jgi:dihydroxyacid dehydratase/phosphogluconate dehydratase